MRADHRRDRQRHHGGDRNRKRQRQREFAEQPADDAVHEDQRREGGHQRQADREHGEADLLGALQRRRIGRHALLEIAVHVLDHDDGVVDHEADGDRQRHQRQIVDGEAGEPHPGAGAGQRQRHRDAGGNGRRGPAQEQEHHEHHQEHGRQQRELHVQHAGADRAGAVDQGRDFDAGRNPLLQFRDQRPHAIDGLDHIGVALLGDLDQHRRLPVEPGDRAGCCARNPRSRRHRTAARNCRPSS